MAFATMLIGGEVGCGAPSRVFNRSTVAPEQLLWTEVVVVGKVASLERVQSLTVAGRHLKFAEISISDARAIRGILSGPLKVGMFGRQDAVPVQPLDSLTWDVAELPRVGEWRIWFLKKDDGKLSPVQDIGPNSWLTASSQDTIPSLENTGDVGAAIARLVMIPNSPRLQPHYPDLLGRQAEQIAVPLVGKHATLMLAEELLGHPDSRVAAKACEHILYFTALPHRCIDRFSAASLKRMPSVWTDIESAMAVQNLRFDSLRSVEHARDLTFQRCIEELPAPRVRTVELRKDCVEFAESAVRALSPMWIQSRRMSGKWR